jgi:hypothetical protein
MSDHLQAKIARFTDLKQRMPTSELPRWSLAEAYEAANEHALARAEYEALVALKPDYCLAWLRLGTLLLRVFEDEAAARKALLEARRLAVEQGHNAPRIEADLLLAEL